MQAEEKKFTAVISMITPGLTSDSSDFHIWFSLTLAWFCTPFLTSFSFCSHLTPALPQMFALISIQGQYNWFWNNYLHCTMHWNSHLKNAVLFVVWSNSILLNQHALETHHYNLKSTQSTHSWVYHQSSAGCSSKGAYYWVILLFCTVWFFYLCCVYPANTSVVGMTFKIKPVQSLKSVLKH